MPTISSSAVMATPARLISDRNLRRGFTAQSYQRVHPHLEDARSGAMGRLFGVNLHIFAGMRSETERTGAADAEGDQTLVGSPFVAPFTRPRWLSIGNRYDPREVSS